jgi:hypothetical protein
MIKNFFDQPVNFFISSTFILLFGVIITSVVLDNANLPNPLTALGGSIALIMLYGMYGKAAFGSALAVATTS